MRTLSAIFAGAAVAFGLYLLAPLPPRSSAPVNEALERENDRLRADLSATLARESAAERRAFLARVERDIWRHRFELVGQPQSWPAVIVSTVYPQRSQATDPANPETIPPPVVPFPTREK